MALEWGKDEQSLCNIPKMYPVTKIYHSREKGFTRALSQMREGGFLPLQILQPSCFTNVVQGWGLSYTRGQIVVKVTAQTYRHTKRLRFNCKIIERSPSPIPFHHNKLHYNNSRLQQKELHGTHSV